MTSGPSDDSASPLGDLVSEEGDGSSLASRTVRGLSSVYISSGIALGAQIVFTAVVSRLLTPADFGLVALAGIILRLFNYFATSGLSSVVVQKEKLDPKDISTAFAGNILLGFAMVLCGPVVAPIAWLLTDDPQASWVVLCMTFPLFLFAVGSVGEALLRRHFRFKALAVCQLSGFIVGHVGVGLFLAMRGFGVWSLVAGAWAEAAIRCVLAIVLSRQPLKLRLDRTRLRVLVSFGGRVSIAGILDYFSSSIDTIAVSAFGGPAMLGNYNSASNVVALPMERAGAGATIVLLPGFARLQNHTERLSHTYASVLTLFAGALIPIAMLIGILAQPLVQVLLGPQWNLAAKLIPIIAIAYSFAMLTHLVSVTLEATGQLNSKLGLESIHVLLAITTVVAAVAYGSQPTYFALAWLTSEALNNVFFSVALRRRLGIAYAVILRAYGEGVLVASLAGIPTLIVRNSTADTPFVCLLAGTVTFAVFGLGAVVLVPRLALRTELKRYDLPWILIRRSRT